MKYAEFTPDLEAKVKNAALKGIAKDRTSDITRDEAQCIALYTADNKNKKMRIYKCA